MYILFYTLYWPIVILPYLLCCFLFICDVVYVCTHIIVFVAVIWSFAVITVTLPFPPKYKCILLKNKDVILIACTPACLVTQLCPTLCDPMDCGRLPAPLSVGFSRQEYGSGLPFPSPGDLPNPGIAPRFPTLQADSLPSEPPGKPLLRIVSSLNTFHGPVTHIGSATIYKYVTHVPRDLTL